MRTDEVKNTPGFLPASLTICLTGWLSVATYAQVASFYDMAKDRSMSTPARTGHMPLNVDQANIGGHVADLLYATALPVSIGLLASVIIATARALWMTKKATGASPPEFDRPTDEHVVKREGRVGWYLAIASVLVSGALFLETGKLIARFGALVN